MRLVISLLVLIGLLAGPQTAVGSAGRSVAIESPANAPLEPYSAFAGQRSPESVELLYRVPQDAGILVVEPPHGEPGPSHASFRVATSSSTTDWSIDFAAPNGGVLVPGAYEDVSTFPGLDDGKAYLRVTIGSDGGCLGGGRFVVHEAEYDDSGFPVVFAVSFQLYCSEGVPIVGRAGELRFNATTPTTSRELAATQLTFEKREIGTTSASQTVTIRNAGSAPLHPAGATITGTHAGDFSVTEDGCSGSTLAPEAACDIEVAFEPTAEKARLASLVYSDDALVGRRTIALSGGGMTTTTTTVVATVNPATCAGGGGRIIATVSPIPSGANRGSLAISYSDGSVFTDPVNLDGTASVSYVPPGGTHQVSATFSGSTWSMPSASQSLTFKTINATTIAVETSLQNAPRFSDVVVSATVYAMCGPAPASGTITFKNRITGEVLGQGVVTADDQTVELEGVGDWPVAGYEIVATYGGSETYASSTSDTFHQWIYPTDDVTAPVGAVQIGAGATWSRTRSVTVSIAATDAGSGVDVVALSNDGVTWTSVPYTPTASWTLAAGDGSKTVWVKWRDRTGNWSSTATDTINVDTVAPSATTPVQRTTTGRLDAGRAPLKLTWSGADSRSGVARYELRQQVDGGAWTSVSTAIVSPAVARSLAPEHTYRYAVRAVDEAGNAGPFAYGPTFRLSRFQESSTRLSYTGTWVRVTSTSYWGGAARTASAAGARATFTFTGRSAAWVSPVGPTRGRASLYVNGNFVTTIDLYASTAQAGRVVWTANWGSSATRKVEIRVVGTASRPRVDVDGFVSTN